MSWHLWLECPMLGKKSQSNLHSAHVTPATLVIQPPPARSYLHPSQLKLILTHAIPILADPTASTEKLMEYVCVQVPQPTKELLQTVGQSVWSAQIVTN